MELQFDFRRQSRKHGWSPSRSFKQQQLQRKWYDNNLWFTGIFGLFVVDFEIKGNVSNLVEQGGTEVTAICVKYRKCNGITWKLIGSKQNMMWLFLQNDKKQDLHKEKDEILSRSTKGLFQWKWSLKLQCR